MYRSASTTRFSDDNYFHYKPTSPKVSPALRALSLEANELPQYEPISEVAKREKARLKFSENAVHLIPLVLLLCGLILWFLSNPELELSMKGDSVAARIEGMTLDGDTDSDGTQRGHFEMTDFETAKQEEIDENRRTTSNIDKLSFSGLRD